MLHVIFVDVESIVISYKPIIISSWEWIRTQISYKNMFVLFLTFWPGDASGSGQISVGDLFRMAKGTCTDLEMKDDVRQSLHQRLMSSTSKTQTVEEIERQHREEVEVQQTFLYKCYKTFLLSFHSTWIFFNISVLFILLIYTISCVNCDIKYYTFYL